VRIGLIVYGDLEQASGGYLYDRMLVAHLRKRGHHVQVISLPWRSYAGFLADNFSRRLFNTIRRLEVDLLLQDELNHPSLFLLNRRLKKETSFPIISVVHMVRSNAAVHPFLKWFYGWVERRYLDSADGFVFNSLETKRLVNSMVFQRKPFVVATPGGDRFRSRVPPAEIRARARQPGPLRVLFLGSLTRHKAPHLLLEAAAKLGPETIYLTLAGRQDVQPDYVRYLRRLAARRGLGGWVHFIGHLEGKFLASRLKRSQVLAVPSAYEGYGIAYLDGLGFGLPAIGTRAGGAKEIIRHGKNGYLIPAGNVAEVARAFKKLHEDRQRLTRMSLSALRSFQTFPSWKESMERVYRFLNRYNQSSSRIHSPRRKK